MSAPTINTQLVDSLAQVILALNAEEQALLGQKLGDLMAAQQPGRASLESFFQSLTALPPDPGQPSVEEITQEVKTVRHELWLNE
jgi:hypothetical protein